MKTLGLNSIKQYLVIIGLFVLTNLNGQNMDSHRWQSRIIIVNTTVTESDKYGNQIEELYSEIEELKDRNIVLYEIKSNKFKFTDFKESKNNQSWKEISNGDAKMFLVNINFRIMLIGLDGGIKLERTEVLKNKELFELIDSMPMRRNELRRKRN